MEISAYIKLIALASVCHVFLGMSLNLAASLPDEKEIVNTIFGDFEKNEDKKNITQYKSISTFLYQKLKDFSAVNEDFTVEDEDFVREEDFADKSYHLPSLFLLDADNVLVVLPTSMGCYQEGGVLFIVNRNKNQWAPVQLEMFSDQKIEKT